ncbi:MAG: hypothetical protein ACOH19_05185 [Rhodoglobus sp.]
MLVPTAIVIMANLGTYEGGPQAVIWLAYAGVLSALTIAAVLVIGLPLRLIGRALGWWRARVWIPIVGALVGIAAIMLSFSPALVVKSTVVIESLDYTAVTPAWPLLIAGWSILAFCVVHFWLPARTSRPAAQE